MPCLTRPAATRGEHAARLQRQRSAGANAAAAVVAMPRPWAAQPADCFASASAALCRGHVLACLSCMLCSPPSCACHARCDRVPRFLAQV